MGKLSKFRWDWFFSGDESAIELDLTARRTPELFRSTHQGGKKTEIISDFQLFLTKTLKFVNESFLWFLKFFRFKRSFSKGKLQFAQEMSKESHSHKNNKFSGLRCLKIFLKKKDLNKTVKS